MKDNFLYPNLTKFTTSIILSCFIILPDSSEAAYFGGKGHFSLRGETRTEPSFRTETQTYQAIDRSFSLYTETKISDSTSLFFNVRLWDKPKESFFGQNSTNSAKCDDTDETCAFSTDSSYEPFGVTLKKVYMTVGTDYCLLTAGRMGRDWGLGVLLDSGDDPFEKDGSVFEGIRCDVNKQKTQNLGFAVGYDKISEGSEYTHGDDLEQYYVSVELDDRGSSKDFGKHIGIYFANITSAEGGENIGSVEYKIFDLYTALYLGNLNLMAEAVFKTGKSEESRWSVYGSNDEGKHSVDSIAFALRGEFTFSREGSVIGVAPYLTGNAKTHVGFFELMRAPGDPDGYYQGSNEEIGLSNRDSNADAFAFHTNYKPAIILFNGRTDSKNMNLDGVFHNERVMNANVFSLGYRYRSVENGSFEAKFISATMIESIPDDVSSYFESGNSKPDDYSLAAEYPVGYFGSDIGMELDLTYSFKVAKSLNLQIAGAYAIPGLALQVTDDKPVNNIAIQTSMTVDF